MNSRDGKNSSNFWGSARDLGLVAVGIVSFSGVIYTYTYLHVLGIDFSAADVSATASLVAASKVFVYNLPTLLTAGIVLAILWAAAIQFTQLHHLRDGLHDRNVQVALSLASALFVCILGNVTARKTVHDIRTQPANGAVITFKPGTESNYPPLLTQSNKLRQLREVLDAHDSVYMLVQPTPIPELPNELPQAQVFSVRKDDVVSIKTAVPNEAL